jgi:hypothetical protein
VCRRLGAEQKTTTSTQLFLRQWRQRGLIQSPPLHFFYDASTCGAEKSSPRQNYNINLIPDHKIDHARKNKRPCGLIKRASRARTNTRTISYKRDTG